MRLKGIETVKKQHKDNICLVIVIFRFLTKQAITFHTNTYILPLSGLLESLGILCNNHEISSVGRLFLSLGCSEQGVLAHVSSQVFFFFGGLYVGRFQP